MAPRAADAGNEGPPNFPPGGRWLMPRRAARSEVVVDAAAHEVAAEVDVGRRAAGGGAAVRLAEIGIEVLDLGAPRADDGSFDAAAERPAYAGFGFAAERGRGLHVAEGGAAGDVRHHATESVADAAARGRQPVVAGFADAADADGVGRAAFDVAPIEVALEAQHHGAHLPVVAERTADHAAIDVEVGRADAENVPGRVAEAPAAV